VLQELSVNCLQAPAQAGAWAFFGGGNCRKRPVKQGLFVLLRLPLFNAIGLAVFKDAILPFDVLFQEIHKDI